MVATLLLTVLFVGSAHAQEAEQSASGVLVLTAEEQQLREERQVRMEEFRAAYEESREAELELRTFGSGVREELRLNRRRCRLELMAALTSERIGVAFRCVRGELTLLLELLRKERTFFENVSDAPIPLKRTLARDTDNLTDAVLAIIDGIDTHVFWKVEQLEKTKQNLWSQYRQQHLLSMLHLRAARLLQWTIFARDALKNLEDAAISTAEFVTEHQAATACLADGDQLLRSAMGGEDFDVAKEEMTMALQILSGCRGFLQVIPEPRLVTSTLILLPYYVPKPPPEGVIRLAASSGVLINTGACRDVRTVRCLRQFSREQSDLEGADGVPLYMIPSATGSVAPPSGSRSVH